MSEKKTTIQKFKKGDWLVRKWKLNNGNEMDYTIFEGNLNLKEFYHGLFIRISNNKIDMFSFGTYDSYIEYEDYRMLYNFRKATKDEINEVKLIMIKKIL